MRTFLTGFSVAWGIFMLIVLLGAGNGLRNGVMYNFRNMSMNKVSVWAGYTTKPWKGMSTNRSITFKETDIDLVRRVHPEIDLCSATVSHSDTLYVNEEFITGRLEGVFPDHAPINYVVVSAGNGRFVNELDMREQRKVIVLSPRMKEVLFRDEPALGKYVRAGGTMLQVIGVYDDDNLSNNAPAYIPFTTARTLYNKGYGLSSFTFTVNGLVSEEANEAFEARFRATLARVHNFDPTEGARAWNTASNATRWAR